MTCGSHRTGEERKTMDDKVRLWTKRVTSVALSLAMVGGGFPTAALQSVAYAVPVEDTHVVILNVRGENKIYDGKTDAKIDTTDVEVWTVGSPSKKLNKDEVGLQFTEGSEKFDTRNVGTDKTVSFGATVGVGYIIDENASELSTTADISALQVGVAWRWDADADEGKALEYPYDGAEHAPYAMITNLCDNTTSAGPAKDDVTAVVSGGQTEIGNNYTATVTSLTGNDAGNYTLGDTEFTQGFSIVPASLDGQANQATITLEKDSYPYTGEAIEPVVTVTVGNNVTLTEGTDYEVTYANNTDVCNSAEENAPSVTVEAVNADGSHCTGSRTIKFSITKDGNQITQDPVAATDLTYDGNAKALLTTGATAQYGTVMYAVTDSETAPDDQAIWSETIPTAKAAGNSYYVWYKVKEGETYQGIDPDSVGPITIAPKELTIIPGPAIKTYDGNTTAEVYYGLNGVVGNDNVVLNQSALTASYDNKNAGTQKTVTYALVTGQEPLTGDAAANYTVSAPVATNSGIIEPKPVTVAGIKAFDKDYDGNTDARLDVSKAVISGVVTITTDQGTEQDKMFVSEDSTGTFADKNVGENKTVRLTNIVLDGADKDNYYLKAKGSQIETKATINRGQAIVIVDANPSLTYDGSQQGLVRYWITPADATVLWYVGDEAPKDDNQWSETAPKATDAGKYTIWYKVNGNDNYEGTGLASVTATISPATPEVTVTANNLTYNAASQKLVTGKVVKGDKAIMYYVGDTAPAADSSSWSKTVPTRKDAGTYTVWYMVPASNNYKGIEAKSVKATIAPAALSVKANAQTKIESTTDPKLTYQISGLKGSDSALIVSGSLTRAAGENPGSYDIQQGSVKCSNANYTIKYVGAKLTITPLPATVAIDPAVGHIQTFGDRTFGADASFIGTTGQSKRMEALQLSLKDQPLPGSIEYTSHIQSIGWESGPWKANGDRTGTTGQSKRMEAVRIKLNGDLGRHYSVWYRVHSQTFGWLAWTSDGQPAGTTGMSKRAEAVQVVIMRKGQTPPATYKGVTQNQSFAFRAS